jgi:hypothetical protein
VQNVSSSATPLHVAVHASQSTGHFADTVSPITGMSHSAAFRNMQSIGSTAPLHVSTVVVGTVVVVDVVVHGPHIRGQRSLTLSSESQRLSSPSQRSGSGSVGHTVVVVAVVLVVITGAMQRPHIAPQLSLVNEFPQRLIALSVS